ncbi:MAG: hypothetical protein LEGION0403_FIIPPAGN_02782 [Legionella sp.]|uniref:IS630 transposase-related protein n=1 Tax=Legionella sp. TaxID=459 RepID=UPI003D0EC708
MTYSLDFRKKVLKVRAAEGLSIEEVAIRFGVGKASVMRWLIHLEPPKNRNKPATKIDMEALKKDVELHPDSYQYERAKRFNVSKTGIRTALIRLKISYKKTWNHPKADEEKRCSFQRRIATFHKHKKMQEQLIKAGMILEYLPPYSPDLNPIEHKWVQAKTLHRTLGCSIDELFQSHCL